MIKDVSFRESELKITSGDESRKIINVGITIYKIVFTSERIVLLLSWEELNNSDLHNRNIVCLDENGQMLWRIVNQDTLSISKEKTYYSWSSLALKNDQCLRVGTISGMDVDVDINTGKLLGNAEYTK